MIVSVLQKKTSQEGSSSVQYVLYPLKKHSERLIGFI